MLEKILAIERDKFRSSYKECMVDALALIGDEGRGKLR